jgi:hypothetical protein
MTSAMTNTKTAKRKPFAMKGVDAPTLLATINSVRAQPEFATQIYKTHRGTATVNNHLPSVWRVNYLHEAPSPEMPEIAHEKARQILQKNLCRAGLWKRPLQVAQSILREPTNNVRLT